MTKHTAYHKTPFFPSHTRSIFSIHTSEKKLFGFFAFAFLLFILGPLFFSWVTFPIIFLNIHLMLKKYMKEFYMFLYMSRIIKCLWLDKQWKKKIMYRLEHALHMKKMNWNKIPLHFDTNNNNNDGGSNICAWSTIEFLRILQQTKPKTIDVFTVLFLTMVFHYTSSIFFHPI